MTPAAQFVSERYKKHGVPFAGQTQRRHDAELKLLEDYETWKESKKKKGEK